jgi:Sec-independent protein translocase protein TatA
MLGVGFSEILIIAFVAFIALGPKHVPDIMRKLASIYRQFINLRNDFRMQLLSLEEEENSKAKTITVSESKHG